MYESYLKDKRVVLVAPGAQTEIMKLGQTIDSYDVVARVGNYVPLNHEQVGSRTDVLMENFWFWDSKHKVKKQELYDEWVRQGTKWVNHIWCGNEGFDKFLEMNQGRLLVTMQDDKTYRDIRKVNGSPTKGMCAIWDMLSLPIKELFIVGFSFSKAFGYRKDYMENTVGMPQYWDEYVDPRESVENIDKDKWAVNLAIADHKFRDELAWFKSIKDPRIKCDEWLEKIIRQ